MDLPFYLEKTKNIIILGAGHGLGFALLEEALNKCPAAKITGTYRNKNHAKDLLDLNKSESRLRVLNYSPLDEDSIFPFSEYKDFPPELVINSIGMLHSKDYGPERSLRDINLKQLTEVFAVNSFITPLILKELRPILKRDSHFIFTSLSAMVGSISDNRLGGWYSYRASKTALNMFIKNASLEFKNSGYRNSSILAVHPGTTETELSKPFLKGIKHKVWQPDGAAINILNTIESAANEGSGLFKNWDGKSLDW